MYLDCDERDEIKLTPYHPIPVLAQADTSPHQNAGLARDK